MILILMIFIGNHVTVTSAEFSDRESCEKAAINFVSKVPNNYKTVWSCERKFK